MMIPKLLHRNYNFFFLLIFTLAFCLRGQNLFTRRCLHIFPFYPYYLPSMKGKIIHIETNVNNSDFIISIFFLNNGFLSFFRLVKDPLGPRLFS